jgi:hypothetical protein
VFCDALGHNVALHTLHLGGNPCGEDGGRHLMVMLQTNDVLQCLTLDGCTFTKRLKVRLQQGARLVFNRGSEGI